MLCGTAYRAHAEVSADRFDELRELCTAAGDKASLTIALACMFVAESVRVWTHDIGTTAAADKTALDETGELA